MEDSKKPLMIIAVVICLIVAVIITLATKSKEEKGINALGGEQILVKCRECGAVYETNHKEHQEYIIAHRTGERSVVPVPCQKCGKEAVYRAIKCNKCGNIFERGSVKGKMPDTCPKCGYSQIVEDRKR
ncbi:MAG: hypothetical protein ACYSSI_11975 [Planctomycetota bacterium]|jgi:predicted RNA-binding Zn-ribbon protein involved in translation (DUF1610 family)